MLITYTKVLETRSTCKWMLDAFWLELYIDITADVTRQMLQHPGISLSKQLTAIVTPHRLCFKLHSIAAGIASV